MESQKGPSPLLQIKTNTLYYTHLIQLVNKLAENDCIPALPEQFSVCVRFPLHFAPPKLGWMHLLFLVLLPRLLHKDQGAHVSNLPLIGAEKYLF